MLRTLDEPAELRFSLPMRSSYVSRQVFHALQRVICLSYALLYINTIHRRRYDLPLTLNTRQRTSKKKNHETKTPYPQKCVPTNSQRVSSIDLLLSVELCFRNFGKG